MWSKILLTLAFVGTTIFSNFAFANTCASIELIELASRKKIVAQNSCYDQKKITILSKSCEKQECLLKKKAKQLLKENPKLSHQLIRGGMGNPAYTLCAQVHGTSYYVDTATFFKSDLNKGLGVCFMPADKSFADMGTLLRWIGFGIKK